MKGLSGEERIFLNHSLDLQKTARYSGREVFSDFLTPREADIIRLHLDREAEVNTYFFGGIKEAERRLLCFYPSFLKGEDLSFPLTVLKAQAQGLKFLSSLPKHSDYLGAVLGLGIERRLIGDIFVMEEGALAFIICLERIADFLLTELNSVGRVKVKTERASFEEIEVSSSIVEKSASVPSFRTDVIVGEVFHLSRAEVKKLQSAERIIVNGGILLTAHNPLKEGDIISVRGHGKFIFYGQSGTTRKNNLRFRYGIYS